MVKFSPNIANCNGVLQGESRKFRKSNFDASDVSKTKDGKYRNIVSMKQVGQESL